MKLIQFLFMHTHSSDSTHLKEDKINSPYIMLPNF